MMQARIGQTRRPVTIVPVIPKIASTTEPTIFLNMTKHIPSLALSWMIAVCGAGCGSQREVELLDKDRFIPSVRTVALVQTELSRTTVQPATVHAYFESTIRPKVSGYVSELRVDIGDVVKQGDTLLVVDIPEVRKQREVIEARIARRRAAERRSSAGIELANAEVQSAKASLAEAESQLDQIDASLAAAESEFRRTEDLVQRGSLQQRVLDEVRKKRDSESAARRSAQSAIESSKAQVTVAEAKRSAAKADMAAAQAETQIARRELEEIDVMIGYATIKAPIDGVVTERHVEPGNLVGPSVSPSNRPLLVVSQIDRVRIRIPVPELDASHVNPGDEVSISFPSFPDQALLSGQVSRRSSNLLRDSRTMPVEVDLDNTDGRLLPGMFGQATIAIESKTMAKTLPSRAIHFDENGNAQVYVVDEKNTVKIAAIRTGADNGNMIEIVDGLSLGAKVIDANLNRFVEGQSVNVLN